MFRNGACNFHNLFQDKMHEVIGTVAESYVECEPSLVENASNGAGCYSKDQNDDIADLNTIELFTFVSLKL